jgi:polyisoprenoid-binding protein YceI
MTTTMFGELTGDYVLDAARTRIGFVARMVLVTRVRGRFDEFEGSVHLDGEEPSNSSARLTIQATSIQTSNRRRDDHLRGAFLDIRHHPAITFTSTGVERVDEATFKVTGDLTIRGVTRPVTVTLELAGVESDRWGDHRVGFTGGVTINRNDWGVNWNAALEAGGILIGEKVTLEFEVVAIRQ